MSDQYSLFQRYGVELEYMLVDTASLDVRPIADRIIHGAGKERKNEIRHGGLRWSNELVLHVLELKTDGPARTLDGLEDLFQAEVVHLNQVLAEDGAMLLPTAMHPWMNPHRETVLWPHGDRQIYQAFDRIFDCRGHGWSNLQSTHLNLPFANEDEFLRLHHAIRLLLPLLPALAASSPMVEGDRGHMLDMRLEFYRHNCRRIPFVTGRVIPERISSIKEYKERILGRIYEELRPHDPEGVICEEWVNARGAIARFERNTIEIRVLDIQECPAADLAILQFACAVLRHLVEETLSSSEVQRGIGTADLEETFLNTIAYAEDSIVRQPAYIEALGLSSSRPKTVGDILHSLLQRIQTTSPAPWQGTIEKILRRGCLSRRIRRGMGRHPTHATIARVYHELAACLREGRLYDA